MTGPTPSEAARLLTSADEMRAAVERHSARESRALLGWGLFALVMLPPFDFLDGDLWGPVMLVASLAGWLTTIHYYRGRTARVRLAAGAGSRDVWIAWQVWYAGLFVLAEVWQSRVGFIWLVSAVCAGLPLLVVGARLARAGR